VRSALRAGGPPPAATGDQADRLAAGVWKVVCVAAIGSFMAQIDATVVNVSLASLAADLHVSLAAIQWVTSGYLLALALMLPLNGWLVDRIGAKALYLWCFSAFTLASALCGLAWSANSLIVFRILQGMSGGLLAPMAQMMIARAAGKHMAQVVSVAALPVLLAPLLGPVIAGAILQFASWRWLFLINLPVGVLALALAAAFLPNDRKETRRRGLDLLGLALLSPGLVLFLYGSDHLDKPTGLAALAVSIILFALFYRVARAKGDAALIDLRLLKGKAFSASVAAMFMVNGISFSGQMLIPIYLVRACGLSPSRTGLLLAPLGLGMLCTYPFMGRLTKQFGIRKLAACGALLALAGTLPLVFLAQHGLVVGVLAASLFIRGVGVSAIGIPSITSGYASVARQDLPMATTAMNIVQRLGGPTMTTLCATFLGWRLSTTPGAGATSGAFIAAFGLLCALHAMLFLATLRLPWLVPQAGPAPQSPALDPGAPSMVGGELTSPDLLPIRPASELTRPAGPETCDEG
jgi:EmrB/QacA subfamily drug resistance transporter